MTLSTATTGASIYYTVDGSTPTTGSKLYSGAINVAATTTLKAIAAKNGQSTSNLLTAKYLLNVPVAKPVFANSTSGNTTVVTITSSTSGASIRYTTDGTTPSSTAGTMYASPVAVTFGQTLKAIAYKSGMPDSAVATALFALPLADAHISYANTGTNYGASATLEVKKQDASTTLVRIAYLRFPLTGVASSIASAKLRLYGASSTATAKNITVSSVSNTTWGESTIVQTNMPAIGAQQGSAVSVTNTGKYWEFDVTSYVQAQKIAGAAGVTFALQQTTQSTDGPTTFNSKENATAKPYLNIVQ